MIRHCEHVFRVRSGKLLDQVLNLNRRLPVISSQCAVLEYYQSSSRCTHLYPILNHRRWTSNAPASKIETPVKNGTSGTEQAANDLLSFSQKLEEIGPPDSLEVFKQSQTIVGELSEGARRELTEAIRKHGGARIEEDTGKVMASEPSRRQLIFTALNYGVPFIGFGIMDNAIMIIAGDAIDLHVGAIFTMSTMCAAAIGNIISDVAGVMMGTVVEDFARKFGLEWETNLSRIQMKLRSVMLAKKVGCAVGITIGCIIGMIPLLFIDGNAAKRKNKEAAVDRIFKDIASEAKKFIGAESTTLFLVVKGESYNQAVDDNDEKEDYHLWSKYADKASGKLQELRIPYAQGIIGQVAINRETISMHDIRREEDLGIGAVLSDTRNMICCPVFDSKGNVIAVINATNKQDQGSATFSESDSSKPREFLTNDIQALQALGTHVSVALQNLEDMDDDNMSLAETIKMLKENKIGV